MRWLRRLLCRIVGHRFRAVYWPDLEYGGDVCRRRARFDPCPCSDCATRTPPP
jgi:hypothetical protein